MNHSASWKRRCTQLLLALVVGFTAMASTPAEANDPPVITGFTWFNPWGDYYAFYGFVVDEYPDECGVGFEGLIDGGGVSTDYDGYFCVIVEFAPGTAGNVYATAMDNLYQLSEVASTFLF